MVKTASKGHSFDRPQSQTSKALILVNCDGVNNYDPWAALQTAVGRLTWTLRGAMCENSLDHIQEYPMRVLSNMSNSFPGVACCALARDVHVSGLCISLSAVIAANSCKFPKQEAASGCNFSIQTAKSTNFNPGPIQDLNAQPSKLQLAD